MRAARLHDGETDLTVEEVALPEVRPGSVVVRIESVFVPPYLADLIDGSGGFATPPRPFVAGQDAVGRIVQVAPDVEGLSVGDTVFCDSYVEAPRADGSSEYAFIGCFELSPGSGPLLARWPNGSLATHMLLPAENATPLNAALTAADVDSLTRLGWMGTAYAAFEKTGFRPGDSVAVLGATGLLGVSAVLVALACGAARVVAVGRSEERLAAFAGLDPRVETATAPPDAAAPVDLVVSTLDREPRLVEAAISGIGRNGALVMLGSFAEPPRAAGLITRDVTLRGSLWFSRSTPARLVRLIAQGALPLTRIASQRFALENVNEALARARAPIAPFEQIVVRP